MRTRAQTKLERKIEKAPAGRSIHLKAEKYRGNLRVDKDLKIFGKGKERTEVEVEDPRRPLISVGPSGVELALKKLTLSGKGNLPSASGTLKAVGDSRIRASKASLIGGRWSVLASGSAKVELSYCRLEGPGPGLVLLDGASGYLHQCKLEENRGGGILLYDRSRLKAGDCLIRYNQIGILVGDLSSAKLSQSKVKNNRNHGILYFREKPPLRRRLKLSWNQIRKNRYQDLKSIDQRALKEIWEDLKGKLKVAS